MWDAVLSSAGPGERSRVSPRAGGEADKFGNRYEGAWTVRQLLYVLIGRVNSITVEEPGPLGEGAEFTLRSASSVEVHQVKRQLSRAATWTIKRLDDAHARHR
jgi:hypothetical protein